MTGTASDAESRPVAAEPEQRRRPRPATGAAAKHAVAHTHDPRRAVAAVARGGAANLAGAVVSAVANFVLTLIVARFVSPTAAGVFFAITSLFLILQTLGRLGADTGSVYFIARWRAMGDHRRVRPGLRSAISWVFGVCCGIAVLVVIFAPELVRLVHASGANEVLLLRVLAVLLPFAALNDVTLGATRGFGWMTPTVLVEKIGRPIVQLVLVAGVLLVGWNSALGLAWALPYVGSFFLAVALLRRAVRTRLGRRDGAAAAGTAAEPPPEPLLPGEVRREFWRFTLPRAAAGVAQIVLQRLDIVLVAVISGPVDAAVYTAATRFLVVGQFANQAIAAPIQPRLSAALSSGATDWARHLYRVSTTWLVLISWPIFGLAASLAPIYVSLFGRQYREGATAVVLLSAAMLVATACGLVDSVVIMAGRTSWNLGTTLLALVLNVGIDLALIPHFGVTGAAIGWFVALLASNAVPLLLAWRGLGLHPFGLSTALACILCGVCFIILPANVLTATGNYWAAGAAVLVGLVLYGWGLLHWRERFELDGLASIRRARRGSSATGTGTGSGSDTDSGAAVATAEVEPAARASS